MFAISERTNEGKPASWYPRLGVVGEPEHDYNFVNIASLEKSAGHKRTNDGTSLRDGSIVWGWARRVVIPSVLSRQFRRRHVAPAAFSNGLIRQALFCLIYNSTSDM